MAKVRNPPKRQEEESDSKWFSMVTYVTEEQLSNWLDEHTGGKVIHYAYCKHDQGIDAEKPHIHVCLNTRNKNPLERVRNWFYKDITADQNTLGQVLHSPLAMLKYLTHTDKESIKLGKQPYSEDAIVSDSLEWFARSTTASGVQREDKTMEILDSILRGDSYRSMIQCFGRDFVVNYRHYQTMATLIAEEESEENPYESTDDEVRAVGEACAKSVAILDGLVSTIA